MDPILFTIQALPPSVNRIYRVGRTGIYKHESVGDFEEIAAFALLGLKKKKCIDVPCRLHVQFMFNNSASFKKSDVDNLLKVLCDFLQHAGVIKNDNLIHEIDVRKMLDVDTQPSTSVMVAPI